MQVFLIRLRLQVHYRMLQVSQSTLLTTESVVANIKEDTPAMPQIIQVWECNIYSDNLFKGLQNEICRPLFF